MVAVASGATQVKAAARVPKQSEREIVCNDHTEHTTLFESDIKLDDVIAVPYGPIQLKAAASVPEQSERELACNSFCKSFMEDWIMANKSITVERVKWVM